VAVDVHQLLREARAAAGLSQDELARRAGTSRPTLSAYENGHKAPSLATLQRLLAGLDLGLSAEPVVRWREYRLRYGRTAWLPSRLWRLPAEDALASVQLPHHLNWSAPGRTFDLRSRRQRARLYEFVLPEADPDELQRFVDGALLVDLWDDLVLPRAVRAAWAPVVLGGSAHTAELPS
jgi:transcriptional regulator with XRE-family HTH domain